MPPESRLKALQQRLRSQDLVAVFLTDLDNIRYLTGFSGSNASVLVTVNDAWFFTDGRYIAQAADQVQGAEVNIYLTEDEHRKQVSTRSSGIEKVAVEAASMTLAQRETFASFFPEADLVAVSVLVEDLRRAKEPEELLAIREAARIADEGLEHILGRVEIGRTERDLALDLEFYMRTHGAEDVSFELIVAGGERSALPHARPTDSPVEPDRFLLFDLGCKYQGYCSDITRTVVVGSADARHVEVYESVLRAQSAGLDALGPGVRCADVDSAARGVLVEAGFGAQFSHGLGHGVGIQIHEAPTLRATSEDVLRQGDVVTIEPGAYFPGWGGVRIEDLAVITKDGYEVLSKSPKDLRSL